MDILKKNDEIELKIESLTSEGSGIAHYNNMAVFVSGVAPDDVVLAHIIKVKKNYCIAKPVKIITPSLYRTEVDCPYFKSCGGCDFRHITYDAELEYKKQRVNDAFQRIGNIDLKVEKIYGAENLFHYRNKVQFPVTQYENGLKTGFFANKSHRIIPIENCLLQSKEFEKGIRAFEKWTKISKVSAYDEKTHKGLVRHLYLRRSSLGEMMVCLVINGKTVPMQDELVNIFKTEVPELKSLCLNINTQKTNVILSDKTKTIYGNDYITDVLCGVKFRISANSFYQVNHEQCEKLYKIAQDFANVSKDDVLLDLYCGTGTIGLSMAKNVKTLVGIEVIESAVKNAKQNAELNNIDNAVFICADAFDGAKQMQKQGLKPNVVVVDPPRKGSAKEVIELIDILSPERVVYVSCDPSTLARDLKIFEEFNYIAEKACAVDLFPRTKHVECVCLLSRKRKYKA